MNKFLSRFTLFSLFILSTALAANTTSTIKGKVVDAEGASVSGASITVVYTPTGNSRSVNSDANGYTAPNWKNVCLLKHVWVIIKNVWLSQSDNNQLI